MLYLRYSARKKKGRSGGPRKFARGAPGQLRFICQQKATLEPCPGCQVAPPSQAHTWLDLLFFHRQYTYISNKLVIPISTF
ncbi:hypothetical protein ACN38_g117 [Penicillium nordicum]|uniref:Uncharacterized protein n=1 Tax=Penicillium nordicum TaxID=229535 RepID=A0A0M8PBE1_9EURO|nr:hypothetical protein ACN38_g117 [Penicillium nordicum]